MRFYKLNPQVIAFVTNHKACREELCKVMNVKPNALAYHLDGNLPNGSLTKYFALEVISKYYNKPIEKLLSPAVLIREVA